MRPVPKPRWGLVIASLVAALPAAAEDKLEDIRALIAKEEQRVKALEQRLAARKRPQKPASVIEPDVRRIIAGYLHDNPGAGMASSVQTGYAPEEGFFIRSVPAPSYVRWNDESALPFSLGIRGSIVTGYSYYRVADDRNHLSGQVLDPPLPDFGQLSIRYARLDIGGVAFDPNLRYQIRLEGFTRALPGVPETHQTTPQIVDEETGEGPISRASFGNAVRLGSQTFLAYDLHPCAAAKGCGPACAPDQTLYAPTLTLIVGRLRPLLGLEAFLGSTTGALVERGLASIFFGIPSATSAGVQARASEDRFYLQALLANAMEGSTPNGELGRIPAATVGLWYDFGGNWNERRKRWDLFGTTLVDLEYSPRPVVRVGGGVAVEPLDSRQDYSDEQSSPVRVMPGGPLGTRLIALLNGTEKSSPTFLDPFAVNTFDDYTVSAYLAGKYRGFNFLVENWFRDLNNFSARNHDPIIYQIPTGPLALFPNHALIDYGMTTQFGYFLVPRKFLLGARWSWIRGDSGNIYGSGAPPSVAVVPGVSQPLLVYPGAFSHFAQANEYTLSAIVYFRGNSLMWLNDVGRYTGGNPAGGRATTGFLPGADGWLLRSRVQLLF